MSWTDEPKRYPESLEGYLQEILKIVNSCESLTYGQLLSLICYKQEYENEIDEKFPIGLDTPLYTYLYAESIERLESYFSVPFFGTDMNLKIERKSASFGNNECKGEISYSFTYKPKTKKEVEPISPTGDLSLKIHRAFQIVTKSGLNFKEVFNYIKDQTGLKQVKSIDPFALVLEGKEDGNYWDIEISREKDKIKIKGIYKVF